MLVRGARSCRDRLLAVLPLLVVVGVAVSVLAEYASGTRGATFALDLVVAAAGCALLPALWRLPVPTALGLAALATLSPPVTPAATAGLLFVARQRPLGTAVAMGTAGVVTHTLRYLWRPMPGVTFTWWFVLVLVAHAALVALGALARARAALLESLRERARRAEAEQGRQVAQARAAERSRIANEMHDVLAHRLSLLATFAGALEYRPDLPPGKICEAAGVIRSNVHLALRELREVITLLHDDAPTEGQEHRPVPDLAAVAELLEESRAAGSPVDLSDKVTDVAALPAGTGRTAYRVLREALTNARKHAPGQPVSITLAGSPGSRLLIQVTNPLAEGSAGLPGSGTGLVGMTERVRLAGGTLDHRATAREFTLRAWLPWPA